METADERGGKEAIHADEDVVPASEARKLAERVRELERLLGRKTMEVEIDPCPFTPGNKKKEKECVVTSLAEVAMCRKLQALYVVFAPNLAVLGARNCGVQALLDV